MDKWEKFWKNEKKRSLPDEYYDDYVRDEDNIAEKPRIRKEGDILIIDDEWYIPSPNNPKSLLLYDKGHHEILDFPLCPKDEDNNPLAVYANNLVVGKNLITGYPFPFIIVSFAFSPNEKELWVRCKQNLEYDACEHVLITFQDGYYIHYIDTFYPYYDTDKDGNQIFYWPWEKVNRTGI